MTKLKPNYKLFLIFAANLAAFSAGAIVLAVLAATKTLSALSSSGFLRYFSMMAAFAFTILTCIDAYAMFAIKTSTYHTSLMALSILVCCMPSPDFLSLFNFSLIDASTMIALLQYGVFVFLLIVIGVFFNFSYELNIPIKLKLGFIAACVADFALFAALYFIKLQFIAFALFMILPVGLTHYVSRNLATNLFNSLSFRPTQFLVFTMCGIMAVNVIHSSEFVSVYPFGITAFYLFAMTITYAFVYIRFITRTQKRALANANYRARYEHIKSKSLQAQIKPHFVFNVLSSVKNLYHVDTQAGDYAIDLFSKHLRAQVEAANTDLIPLEKELDNINIFIDLENIRRERDLNVIFDIDYSDFLIPALSLQPFIENAIKYSKISDKKDGYILISSHCDNGQISLEISDNGVGFDPQSVPQSSYGIRNSVERFRLLTGSTPEIVSSPGNGTKIIIRFNKTLFDKPHENQKCQ